MANTAESDFEYAKKNYEPWKSFVQVLDPDLLREAYESAWNSGHRAGYRDGSYDQSTQPRWDELGG